MKKQFDFLVFIGRFQPVHKAHLEILKNALELSKKVIVLVGSSYQPRTSKNPFTAQERERLIRLAHDTKENKQLRFRFLSDKMYNDQQWAIDVQSQVQSVFEEHILYEDGDAKEYKVGIIGHRKDNSSFYLDMFPQWELVEFPNVEDFHATTIRDYYFNPKWLDPSDHVDVFYEMCKDALHPQIFAFMCDWRSTDEFKYLSEEYAFYQKYHSAWDAAPYRPTFVTVDAVVVQSGHILLVKRRSYPGKGLWAIPGGFLDVDESIVDSMIRELREETKLKVPAAVLRGSVKDTKVFDHPQRSLRGRTITHAHLVELNPGPLPAVKGADDAEKAKWFTLDEVLTMEDQLFEDHFSIINYFIGRV